MFKTSISNQKSNFKTLPLLRSKVFITNSIDKPIVLV